MTTTPSARPTGHFTVVEYGDGISAAHAGKMLADFGATVIKVEPPEGDALRRAGPFPGDVPDPEKAGHFLYLNTNKYGVTLNPALPTGRAILLKLLDGADAFITNAAPSRLAAERLAYADLKASHPRLVVTTITPWGMDGPYKDRKSTDLTMNAAGGFSWGIGMPDGQPLQMPYDQSQYQGGLSAAGATLAALFARYRTGRGQHVDIAIAEVLACFYEDMYMPAFVFQGVMGRRQGYRNTIGRYPQTLMQCKDGYVSLSAPQKDQWVRFVKVLGEPEWTKDPRFRDRRAMAEQYPDEVDALLRPWFMARTKKEIFALCEEAHVPFAPVRTVAEVAEDAHSKARSLFAEVAHPRTGVVRQAAAPFRLTGSPWRVERPAPTLGQHNVAVYCERLGYTPADLVDLHRAGVI